MNDRLQFSWGHIIAFLALIATGYFTFVGIAYATGGNFLAAGIATALTVIVYILVFVGAQQLKASNHKMSRKIVIERILIWGSPLVFVAGMFGTAHFWTVNSRNDDIVKTFTSSINNSKQLFADYELYCDSRINAYSEGLDKIIASAATQPEKYRQAGFIQGKEKIQKANMVETLTLQLRSPGYMELKNKAVEWIDKSAAGASTYNVFLIGNTREIKESITRWHSQLQGFTENRLSNEELAEGSVPSFTSNGAQAAISGIDKLQQDFSRKGAPTLPAIICAVVVYLMLLFPYFLQERHSQSIYTFRGRKTAADSSDGPIQKGKNKKENSSSSTEDDDYSSF